MSRARFVLLVCLCVSIPTLGAIDVGAGTTDDPAIEAVVPNPVADGNRGEYVVLNVPESTSLAGWTLTDGTHTVQLPNRTVQGRVVLSQSPAVTELLVSGPVYGWEGHLRLAADGDELVLRDPSGNDVDAFVYHSTSQGDAWHRENGTVKSSVTGDTAFAFDRHGSVNMTAFVLPDAPDTPTRALERAEDRIWLAGYELSEPDVVATLLERHAAGVDVRVLVDGRPVGGQAEPEVVALDMLVEAGIPVRVIRGDRRRYRFHHPKYAIVDQTAIVLTENWKPSGTGGTSSRGWGVTATDRELADDLAAVFLADHTWRDTVAWERFRHEANPQPVNTSVRVYPEANEPAHINADAVRLVVAPDNAESVLLDVIDAAETSIDVQQVRISDIDFPLLEALIDAASRGVTVRIHLDSTWYVATENDELAERLIERAADDDLPLSVRLVEPGVRFEKIHTKGMIVDEEVVVIGSLNWNNVSMRENREILLVIEDASVGAYYTEIFEGDWRSRASVTPIGLVLIALMAWVSAATIASRRVTFAE